MTVLMPSPLAKEKEAKGRGMRGRVVGVGWVKGGEDKGDGGAGGVKIQVSCGGAA